MLRATSSSSLFALAFFTACLSNTYAWPTTVPTSPMFYGWFFNEQIAEGLQNITDGYLANLYENNPIFASYLRLLSTEAQVKEPLQYYTKPADPNTGKFDPFYHITAHYCGTQDCSNYTKSVERLLGRNFSTQLIGVFMTPRTYGIRVNLSDEQNPIFQRSVSNVSFLLPMGPSRVVGSRQKFSSDYPGIDFEDQDSHNFHPTKSRAHVTLGCAPNETAVTTGTDLLEIIELEKTPGAFCSEFTQEHGTLVRMGKNCDIFVYYLNQKMVANAEFQVYNNKSSRPKLSVFEYGIFGISFVSVIRSFVLLTQ